MLQNENIKKGLLKGGTGSVRKPYFDVWFDAPSTRNFTFDFKMAPKNVEEAVAIQNIVRLFKAHAAPVERKDDGLFWYGYPNQFQIEYWNQDNLHKFKPCVLQNINVNYSGTGTNHTFYDGHPLQTDLTLQFMEAALLTREDFVEGGF